MAKEKVSEKIDQLSEELEVASRAYYYGDEIISDAEFDAKLAELKKLETDHPELKWKNSPTDRIGSDLDTSLEEYPHSFPVVSLDKVYTEQDLEKFKKSVFSKNPRGWGIVFSVEPKIDGMSIVLYYRNGELERALTRGDGKVGNDITANAKTISGLPFTLDDHTGYLAVRGEAVIYREDFEEILEKEPDIKNARNFVAGLMKRKDSRAVAKYRVHFVAYDLVLLDTKPEMYSDRDAMEWLDISGFETVDVKFVDFDSIESAIRVQREKNKEELPYATDGVVVKVDSFALREKLGYSHSSPNWAIAYKFESEEASTVLKGVTYQVGRTGKVTPIADLEPVWLNGTVVKRASLHNEDLMKQLGLKYGDTVVVSKRGEIIPQVERVEFHSSGAPIEFTKTCPSCGSILVRDGAHTFCNNRQCRSRVIAQLSFFVSKSHMDIDGMSGKAIETLYDLFFITSPEDLYLFDYDMLLDVPGFGKSTVEKFKSEIEKSKKATFIRLLKSLGISGLGERTVDLLFAAGYDSLEKLFEATADKLVMIQGIGVSTAMEIEIGLEEYENVLIRFKQMGFSMEAEIEKKKIAPVGGPLSGMYFGLTGEFENYKPRKALLEKIRSLGGEGEEGVSSKTTHLVIGNKPGGGKLKKAEKMGIPVISEQDIEEMMRK